MARHAYGIELFLRGYSGESEATYQLLDACCGRILRRDFRNSDVVEYPCADEIRHISDWLASSVMQRKPWILNVDEKGRPKKLLKFPSFKAIRDEADKWMIVESQKHSAIRLSNGDESVWMVLRDGYTLVRLHTPEALDRESSVMQHCIGGGSYDHHLSTDSRIFLSLRDRFSKSHATIDFNVITSEIVQLSGKQNRPPIPEYIKELSPFFLRDDVNGDSWLTSHGYCILEDGGVHPQDCIPDGSIVVTSVSISLSGKARLPTNSVFKNGLVIRSGKLEHMPDGLAVMQELSLIDCQVQKIHFPVSSGISVSINDSKIGEMNIPHFCSLRVINSDVVSFPDHIDISGDFTVENSNITEWPRSLRASSFRAFRTNLVTLPQDWDIVDGIDVNDCPLKSMPGRERVGASLILKYTKVRDLSSIRLVGGDMLVYPSLERLSDELSVRGSLDIGFSPVSRLPASLSVGKDFNASQSGISVVPACVRIGGNVDISYTDVSEIECGTVVSGHMDITGTRIRHVPHGCKISHVITACSDLSVSEDAEVVLVTRSSDWLNVLKMLPDEEFHFDTFSSQW